MIAGKYQLVMHIICAYYCPRITEGGTTTYEPDGQDLTQVPNDIPRYTSTLILSNQKISAIEKNDFSSLTSLKIADLSKNEISYFHMDALQKNVNLERLYLNKNKLPSPPNLSGAKHSIISLHVKYNRIENVPNMYLTKMGNIKYIYLDSNRIMKIYLGKLENLKTFSIPNNNLQIMPVLNNTLPALNVLYLHYNNISYISQNYFNKTPNVTTLRLNNNALHEIPNLMPIRGSLIGLNLEDNKITISNEESISMLTLQNFDISGNSLNVTFGSCPRLQEIIISNYRSDQKLMQMPILLKSLDKLRKLDVAYNEIREISHTYFRNTPRLLELNLASNELREFQIENRSNLTILKLQQNKLNAFSCRNMIHLSVLVLNNNDLKQFPNLTDCAQTLTTLQMHNNDIVYDMAKSEFLMSSEIASTKIIPKFPEMSYLRLTWNIFTTFNTNFFQDFPKLTHLLLEHCDLEKFPNISVLAR